MDSIVETLLGRLKWALPVLAKAIALGPKKLYFAQIHSETDHSLLRDGEALGSI